MVRFILDRAAGVSRLERMKLLGEYNKIRQGVSALNRIERMRALKRINEIRTLLGAVATANTADIEFIQSIVDGQANLLLPGIIERFKDVAVRLSVNSADLVKTAKTAAVAWFRNEYQIRSA